MAEVPACPLMVSLNLYSLADLDKCYSQIVGLTLTVITFVSKAPQPQFPLALPKYILNSALRYMNSIKLLIFATHAMCTWGTHSVRGAPNLQMSPRALSKVHHAPSFTSVFDSLEPPMHV